MFLVRYEKKRFVNAEQIVRLGVGEHGHLFFTLQGSDEEFFVENSLAHQFLNHVGAIDSNILGAGRVLGDYL